MTRNPFVLSISLLAFLCVGVLQNDSAAAQGRRRGDNPQTGTAVAREASPPPAAAPAAAPVRAAEEGAQQAQPRNGGRDRGGNPQTGTAVPRQAVPGARGGRVFVGPPVRSYYYNPYRYYPYGYGAFGLGYFYYDPYLWYGAPYYGGYYPGYGGYGYYNPVGELRVEVKPNVGDVYVDGYYAGRVDDYDGVFQSLKLEAGAHHIQVTAPGYAPLDFDVRIDPGRKITYRGAMVPARP